MIGRSDSLLFGIVIVLIYFCVLEVLVAMTFACSMIFLHAYKVSFDVEGDVTSTDVSECGKMLYEANTMYRCGQGVFDCG